MVFVRKPGGRGILRPHIPSLTPREGVGASGPSLGVRSTTYTAQREFENWLGKVSVGHLIHFCESGNGSSTWAQNLTQTQAVVTTWAARSTRIEWAFPLCSTTQNLAATIAGTHDATITSMFQAIAAADAHSEIWIRLGWEMNLAAASGYPWSAIDNSEADYIAAFRHVVDLARAVSSRFIFVWAFNWSSTLDPSGAYPGDAYVDVIGMDEYLKTQFDQSSGQTGAQVWTSKVNGPYGYNFLLSFAATHGKRIAIPETGQNADEPDYMNSKAAWIKAQTNLLYWGYWDQTTPSGANCKLSNGQYPNTGLAMRQQFGNVSAVRDWTPLLAFGTDLVTWLNLADYSTITESGGSLTAILSAITPPGATSPRSFSLGVAVPYSATARNGKPGMSPDGITQFLRTLDVVGVPAGQAEFGLLGQLYMPAGAQAFKYLWSDGPANPSGNTARNVGFNGGRIRIQMGGSLQSSADLSNQDVAFVLGGAAGASQACSIVTNADVEATGSVASNAFTPTRSSVGAGVAATDVYGAHCAATIQEIIATKRVPSAGEKAKYKQYADFYWRQIGSAPAE